METEKPIIASDIDIIHKLSIEDASKAMHSRIEGLSTSEFQVFQAKHGKNVIRETKKKSVLLVLLSNFISVMAILLWIGGVVAFFAGMPELGVAIWLVNIINGVFSFWQEYRAGKATEVSPPRQTVPHDRGWPYQGRTGPCAVRAPRGAGRH